LNPKEFKEMVKHVREAEASLGKADYSLSEKSKSGKYFSRSLYFSKNIKKGDVITSDSIRSVRPGFGMHPMYMESVIGKTVNMNVEIGDRVLEEVINGRVFND
jgi:pseudaminic acid synthase